MLDPHLVLHESKTFAEHSGDTFHLERMKKVPFQLYIFYRAVEWFRMQSLDLFSFPFFSILQTHVGTRLHAPPVILLRFSFEVLELCCVRFESSFGSWKTQVDESTLHGVVGLGGGAVRNSWGNFCKFFLFLSCGEFFQLHSDSGRHFSYALFQIARKLENDLC